MRLLDLHPRIRVAVGSDRTGSQFKAHLVVFLRYIGHDVVDLGTDSAKTIHYRSAFDAATKRVAVGESDLSLLVGPVGQGEQIVPNPTEINRDGLNQTSYTSRISTACTNTDVLVVARRVVTLAFAEEIVTAWLGTVAAWWPVTRIRALS